MTRPMSVSMTLDAVRNRTKTVTRRHVDSWENLKAGDRLTLIEKGMGLPKGAKQVVVCDVEIVDVRVEPLGAISQAEVVAEGFPSASPLWFIDFWKAGHGYGRKVHPDFVPCRRIEWRYLDGEAA